MGGDRVKHVAAGYSQRNPLSRQQMLENGLELLIRQRRECRRGRYIESCRHGFNQRARDGESRWIRGRLGRRLELAKNLPLGRDTISAFGTKLGMKVQSDPDDQYNEKQ